MLSDVEESCKLLNLARTLVNDQSSKMVISVGSRSLADKVVQSFQRHGFSAGQVDASMSNDRREARLEDFITEPDEVENLDVVVATPVHEVVEMKSGERSDIELQRCVVNYSGDGEF